MFIAPKEFLYAKHKYFHRLFSNSGPTSGKPTYTPLGFIVILHRNLDSLYLDMAAYRCLFGYLLYLTPTRLDHTFPQTLCVTFKKVSFDFSCSQDAISQLEPKTGQDNQNYHHPRILRFNYNFSPSIFTIS